MAERILRVKWEGTYGTPQEVAPKRIDVFVDKNGDYFAKYIRLSEYQGRIATRIEVDSNEIDEIFETLSTLSIPAVPIPNIGCDGGYTELEVGGYTGLSHFRWWSVPPDGWEVLNEIAGKIISKIDYV